MNKYTFQSNYSDVELRCTDDKTVWFSKYVLCEYSDWFIAFFYEDPVVTLSGSKHKSLEIQGAKRRGEVVSLNTTEWSLKQTSNDMRILFDAILYRIVKSEDYETLLRLVHQYSIKYLEDMLSDTLKAHKSLLPIAITAIREYNFTYLKYVIEEYYHRDEAITKLTKFPELITWCFSNDTVMCLLVNMKKDIPIEEFNRIIDKYLNLQLIQRVCNDDNKLVWLEMISSLLEDVNMTIEIGNIYKMLCREKYGVK